MAGNKSDYVLDDGLDDDEDILAYHSEQQAAAQAAENPPSPPDPVKSPSAPLPPIVSDDPPAAPELTPPTTPVPPESEPDAIIIDGLPLSTTRPSLFRLLGVTSDDVSNVRLRRLDAHGLLRVRVTFCTPALAAAARRLDGSEWEEKPLSVKPASEERWAASMPSADSPPKQPNGDAGGGFWAAFGAARAVAEQLEQRARSLGNDLESKLQVTERLEAGAKRVREVDQSFKVTERVDGLARAGLETAEQMDERWGISDSVGAVMDNVGDAAMKMAREVDENLRVSDKARNAANAAMSSPTMGRVARSVVSTLDGGTPTRRKKSYKPRSTPGGEANEEDVPLSPSTPATPATPTTPAAHAVQSTPSADETS